MRKYGLAITKFSGLTLIKVVSFFFDCN